MVERGDDGGKLLVCHSLLMQHISHAVRDDSRLLQGPPVLSQGNDRLRLKWQDTNLFRYRQEFRG